MGTREESIWSRDDLLNGGSIAHRRQHNVTLFCNLAWRCRSSRASLHKLIQRRLTAIENGEAIARPQEIVRQCSTHDAETDEAKTFGHTCFPSMLEKAVSGS